MSKRKNSRMPDFKNEKRKGPIYRTVQITMFQMATEMSPRPLQSKYKETFSFSREHYNYHYDKHESTKW